MMETESRPAYLDEFERKLTASLARQTEEARGTRLGFARSSDSDVEVPSSLSFGEAITSRSMGEKQALDVGPLWPSSQTRDKRTQFYTTEPTRVSPQGDNPHDAVKAPPAGETADVHVRQSAARRPDLAETSSGRAVKSPTEPSKSSAKYEAPPAVTHALPNEPTQEIGALIDFEALLANVEASLANDAEAAQFVKPANLRARAVAEVKRFSRDWKLMASACAFVGVAIIGVVSHGRLANQTGWRPYGAAVGEVYPAAPGGFVGPNGYTSGYSGDYVVVPGAPVSPDYTSGYSPAPAYGGYYVVP